MLGAVSTWTRRRPFTSARLVEPIRRVPWSLWGVIALAAAFLAMTAWWLTADSRVPDYDNAKHLGIAFSFYDAFKHGNQSYWFTTDTEYPPLVHLVGAAAGYLRGGVGVEGPTMLQDLVFVPLLALGCYGAGTLSYGRRAGLLAVLFALGTPILISQFHVFMLDAPQAALVACTVWLVLASDRFSHTGLSALAGVAFGAGMLVKHTFVLFVMGLLAVVVLRGGWRNWRGLAAFAVAGAVIAAPWYVEHWQHIHQLALGATTDSGQAGVKQALAASSEVTPPRWSSANYFWYFWNLVNHQLLLPLTLFVVAGVGWALVRVARTRRDAHLTLELVVGLVVAFAALTFLTTLHDPRYTLPALVYLAVLGSGWITQLRRPLAIAAATGLLALVAINTAAVTFGLGSAVQVKLPGAPAQSGLGVGRVTLYSSQGYVVGGPVHGPLPDLMHAIRRDGYLRLEIDFYGGAPFFNASGLGVLGREASLLTTVGDGSDLRGRDAVFMVRRPVQPGTPKPCADPRLGDGTALWLTIGRPPANKPLSAWKLYCPLRSSARS
jgi:4-amino-4-deoxy-L-arabinose transferase-like glycosyltransferase